MRRNIMRIPTRYFLGILLLAGCLGLSGCIHDDCEDCLKEGNVDIALTHYWHNKGNADNFAREINRVEFYIFDGEGLFYSRDLSPKTAFTNGYHYRLTLPGGDYTVLSWCNGGTAWLSDAFIPGVTTLEEARMKLTVAPTSNESAYKVPDMPESLFFGRTREEKVHVKNGKTVHDSIDLLRVTNDVRVRIRWKDHAGIYCNYKGHEDNTLPYLEIKNGEYDFTCRPLRERFLTYMPQLLPSEEESPVDYASVRADFRVGRLMSEGSTAKLSVGEVSPDGSVTRRYTRSLVELIRLTGHYDTQEQLDREDHFNVDIDFCCLDSDHTHGDSWSVLGIVINGWVISDLQSEL